jgi:hypothetical protein
MSGLTCYIKLVLAVRDRLADCSTVPLSNRLALLAIWTDADLKTIAFVKHHTPKAR